MIERLRKRRDFLAAAKGSKAARRAFVLEAVGRGDDAPPRFGFTVSKKVAKKAVERNRIRRRLRELARLASADARAGHDYVLIGRRGALAERFADLAAMLGEALQQTTDSPNSRRHSKSRSARR
jgi:ribonuclease P protein component